MAERSKAARPKTTRRRKKPAATSALGAAELRATEPPREVAELVAAIEREGGAALAPYREPYGGRWVVMAALPIEQVEATPYQRNISETHVRRLARVIDKIGRFLDPIIVVRALRDDSPRRYWTPNGHHRLTAMRSLGAKAITAIVVPESSAAYQILALNTEKAHNLRERALEVIRMYTELVRISREPEASFGLEFEEGALVTLGICYEERPRFSGGAYYPILKRVDVFLDQPLEEALTVRQARARTVLTLDDVVMKHVERLKARGLTSPYLKAAVVARLNPLRFRPREAPSPACDDMLAKMIRSAEKFDPERLKPEELARAGGPPEEA